LVNLRSLRLAHNQLHGAIPASLGNLTLLWELLLNGNRLAGPVPTSLANLTGLTVTNIGYNALTASDEALITFLNAKDPDWAATQTIAPADVTATSLDNCVIMVSWLPVAYTADPGLTNVYMSQTAGGPYTLAGSTADKATTALNITGLTPAETYYFVVRTQTNAHADNTNIVESDASTEASAVAWLTLNTILSRPGVRTDDPDASFVRVPAAKVDFNNDGQEDILWRYFGPGGYNRVWFMGNTGEPGETPLMTDPLMAARTMSPENRTPANGLIDPRDLGLVTKALREPSTGGLQEAMTVAGERGRAAAAVNDPRRVSEGSPGLFLPPLADPRSIGPGARPGIEPGAGEELLSAPVMLGGADVLPLDDAAWEIAALADFNRDNHTDILWRHNGPGGENVLWLMDGTGGVGSAGLPPVPDPDWHIVGTGDFNNDTHTDLLWRHSGGANLIWYMNGTDVIGSAELVGVSDPAWQIVGTGDFNRDGHIDVLWHYDGSGGSNVVWHLDGTGISGIADLVPVADLSWQIAATGDYNNDGHIDILWHYDGPGGFNYIWYMDQAGPIGGAEIIPGAGPLWRIVSRQQVSRLREGP